MKNLAITFTSTLENKICYVLLHFVKNSFLSFHFFISPIYLFAFHSEDSFCWTFSCVCAHTVNSNANCKRNESSVYMLQRIQKCTGIALCGQQNMYCLVCRHVSTLVAKRWDDIKFCSFFGVAEGGGRMRGEKATWRRIKWGATNGNTLNHDKNNNHRIEMDMDSACVCECCQMWNKSSEQSYKHCNKQTQNSCS